MKLITIAGDRQTGKTEMALDSMVSRAVSGDRVAYIASARSAEEAHRRTEKRGGHSQSHRALGQQRVDYVSGGCIHFLPAGHGAGRGLILDCIVVDVLSDADRVVAELEPCLVTARNPTAVIVQNGGLRGP